MNELLAQIIVVARNGDRDRGGWMQLLVLGILAAFYVVGSLIKAKTNKLKEQGEEARGGEKSKLKPAEGVRARKPFEKIEKVPYRRMQRPAGRLRPEELGPQAPPVHRKVMRAQRVSREVAAEKERAIRFEGIETPKVAKLGLAKPKLEPEFEELPEFTEQAVKKVEDKYTGIFAEKPQAKPIVEPLLDYEEPDKLRRAILHYEILGKPLSLRAPGEHIIGL